MVRYTNRTEIGGMAQKTSSPATFFGALGVFVELGVSAEDGCSDCFQATSTGTSVRAGAPSRNTFAAGFLMALRVSTTISEWSTIAS